MAPGVRWLNKTLADRDFTSAALPMTLSSSSTDDAHTLSPRGRDSSSRSRAGRHVLNEWRKRKRGPRTCCVLIFFFLSIHLPIDKPRPWRLRNNPTSLSFFFFSLFISFLRFFASSCGEVTFCISFSSFMEARKRETHGRSIWCFPKVHSGLSVYYVCIYTSVVVAFLRRRLGPFGGRQQQQTAGVTGGSFMPRHHHHHWHGFDFTSISSFLLFVIWSSTSVTRVAKEVCLFFVFCFRFLSRCGRKRPAAAAEGAMTDGCTLPAGHHGHLEPEAEEEDVCEEITGGHFH